MMKTFWIVAILVVSCSVYAKAQSDEDYDNYFNYDDLDDIGEAIDEVINESLNKKTDVENDLKVEEEIQLFRDAGEGNVDTDNESKKSLDNTDDYQIEDNRESKEAANDVKKDISLDSDYDFAKFLGEAIANNDENRPEPDDPNAPSRNEDYALLWGDDNIAPLPVPETSEEDENEAIIKETKRILEEQDTDYFEEEIQKEIEKSYVNLKQQPNLDQVIEETKQILAESDDLFDESKSDNRGAETLNSDKKKSDPKVVEDKVEQEEEKPTKLDKLDTENFIQDIDSDAKPEDPLNLEQIIQETKQLLSETDDSFDDYESGLDTNSVETANSDNKVNEDQEIDGNKVEQEEEDTVDKVYADLNADLDKLFATLDKLKNDISENKDDDIDKALKEADKLFEEIDNKDISENSKFDDIDLDKLFEDILGEDDRILDDSSFKEAEPILNDAIFEPNPDDTNEKDVELLDRKAQPIHYVDDALVNESKPNAEALENSNANEDLEDASIETQPIKKVLIDELNSSELQDLVEQFKILHEEEFDNLDNLNSNVMPVRLSLKLDEPTVITSHPEFPRPYPNNLTLEWILEGPGEGIELNITDFAVNGVRGDYLLIKPGRVDDSGTEGILFTYRLRSARNYRFTDVSRLFMRFVSNSVGQSGSRGFSISAKMIAPFPPEPEPISIPEPVVSSPHSTVTVTLALPVADFIRVNESFREVLADMAQEYIMEYGVEPGLNTTSEVTQITSVNLCPMTWPGYEHCSAVTFGVSLVYEDDDQDPRLNESELKTMWVTYVDKEPYALRLKEMGISEFNGPNGGAMMLWLVVTTAVILCMMMMAFVLWRYSCFEGYTRMKVYSDTDSIVNEKRTLDLYPTPHQTLPPLYADTLAHEYKWPEDDTRVDMGGFANNSYMRENMYDFESDEDVIATRDRIGAVTTKDYSSNA